jgi:cardiolipin synthase
MIAWDMTAAFIISYIILGSTDFFDGLIARRFNQTSEIGKALDSIADLPFYISSAYFLYRLFPEYLEPNQLLLLLFFGLLFLSFIVSAILCKKPIMMHTTLLRLNGVLVYALIIFSFFFNTTLFVSAILIIYFIGFTEEIIIFIKYGEVDPDTPTIFSLSDKSKDS